jgi:hypothetical protein
MLGSELLMRSYTAHFVFSTSSFNFANQFVNNLSPFQMTYLCILNYNNVIKEIQLEVNKGAMLPLMEELYNSRRGFHTGTAAYFVRIGGCDVGCHGVTFKES